MKQVNPPDEGGQSAPPRSAPRRPPLGRGRPPRRPRRKPVRPLSVHRFRWAFQLFFLLVSLGLLSAAFWPVFSGLVSGFLLADPLIAATAAARGLFRWEMLLVLPVLLSPLFLGRVFCGYACPMGFLIELAGPKKARRRRRPRPGSGSTAEPVSTPAARKILRKVPLFGLVTVIVFILLGSAWFLVADPISLFTRSATTLVYPALDRLITWGGDLLYRVDAFKGGVDSVTNVLTGRLVFENGLHFALQILILVMFVAVLALSWIERRLWCRHLCPLGALLGLVGRFALFGRVVDESTCTGCGACARACPMDAVRDDGRTTDMSRCECGLECKDVCRQGAVHWGWKPRKQYAYDPSRRALLAGGVVTFAGAFGVFKLLRYLQPGAAAVGNAEPSGAAKLIRPPGALAEADFLATCSRCGECLKVCPTNVLQPAVFEAGLEGVFTPRLDFTRSFCEYNCAECGKVCPTRSIRPLALAQKQRTVIGLAVIDHKLCIPWSQGKECLVCEELCPVAQKAIGFEGQGGQGQGGGGGAGGGAGDSGNAGDASGAIGEGDGAGDGESDGATDTSPTTTGLKLPRVLDRHCIGCGICQYNCPVQDPAPAIVVRRFERTTTAES
jgi:polyferredoxin